MVLRSASRAGGNTGQKTALCAPGRSGGHAQPARDLQIAAAVQTTTAAAALPASSPEPQQHSAAAASQVERVPATPLAEAGEEFHSPRAGTPMPAGTSMPPTAMQLPPAAPSAQQQQHTQEDTGNGSMQQLRAQLHAVQAELEATRADNQRLQHALDAADSRVAALQSQLQTKDAELQAQAAELKVEQDAGREARQEVHRLLGELEDAHALLHAAADQPQRDRRQQPAAAHQPAPSAPTSRVAPAAGHASRPAAGGAGDEGGWQQQRRRGRQHQRHQHQPGQRGCYFKAVVPVACRTAAEDLVAGSVSKLVPDRPALASVMVTRVHETKAGPRHRLVLFQVTTEEGASRLQSALRTEAARSLRDGVRLFEALPPEQYKARQALRSQLMQRLREQHAPALAQAREQNMRVGFALRGTAMTLYIGGNQVATTADGAAAEGAGGGDPGADEPGQQPQSNGNGTGGGRSSGRSQAGRGQ